MIAIYYLLLVAAGMLSAKHIPHPQPRITEGKPKDIKLVPWQVSVQASGVHHCGGAIFSEKIIITAAHCFYKEMGRMNFRHLQNEELIILAGSNSKRLSTIYTGVIAKMHHEKYKYNQTNFQYDIGIMKVSDKLPRSDKVKPIPLAKSVSKKVSISGWGLIWDNGYKKPYYPEYLRMADVQISKCQKKMPIDILCSNSKIPSACHGDDGGPATFNRELVGIIVGQHTSCFGPTFLINVPHYHKWLLNAIKLVSK